MNPKKLLSVSIVFLLAAWIPVVAQPAKRRAKRLPSQTVQTPGTKLKALLHQTQKTVELAQAETRRARELNEVLQRQLASNTEEIVQLRQTITAFGSQLSALSEQKKTIENVTAPIAVAANVPEVESLKSEVEILKEQVDVHTSQIKEHAQTKVESDSKFRVKLNGMILANTYLNTNDSTLNDVPLFAAQTSSGKPRKNLGASLRQSRFGFTMDGPRLSSAWGEAQLSAEAEFDFWAGENTDVLGQLRIITASARLDWEKTSFIVGQRPPLVSPRNPSSLAAVWFAPFHQAGNLWQWRPQIVLEHRLRTSEDSELRLQGGILMPFGETVQGTVIEGGAGYETRAAWGHPLENDQTIEFGIGGYFHRRPFELGRKVDSHALTTDWLIPLGSRFEFSGEAFGGRAINLGEASGFRNDRLYAINGRLDLAATQIRGVFTVGGWAQMKYKARPDLDFNVAYGQEDPRNSDLRFDLSSFTRRFKNQAASVNFIYTLRQNFLVSLEYRRLWTDYATSRQRAGHYNLAFGYTF